MYLILAFRDYAAESGRENVSSDQRLDMGFVGYKKADVGVIT
jgi:hypothetical protein